MTVDIANKLMTMRKEHGLSQEELADRLGVSRQSVGKWERAESSPDTDNLILLAQLYGVSLDKLLGTGDAGEQGSVLSMPTTAEHSGSGVRFSYDIAKTKEDKNIKTSGLVALVALLVFLMLGAFGYWHPAWLVFLAVPILEFVVKAIINRYSAARFFVNFPFVVLVTAVYLTLGCLIGGWGVWWIVFVAVPLYHIIVGIVFAKHASISYSRYDKHGNKVASYDKAPDQLPAVTDSNSQED